MSARHGGTDTDTRNAVGIVKSLECDGTHVRVFLEDGVLRCDVVLSLVRSEILRIEKLYGKARFIEALNYRISIDILILGIKIAYLEIFVIIGTDGTALEEEVILAGINLGCDILWHYLRIELFIGECLIVCRTHLQ